MNLSDAGKLFIKSFEQCRLRAYQDQAGVWTIGWGHTGEEVAPALFISQHTADAWFDQDSQEKIDAVNDLLAEFIAKDAITQGMFDALVSFAFNDGAQALADSTLLAYVRKGELGPAAEEFPKWCHVHVNGVAEVSRGLVIRRNAEAKLFLS